MNEFIIKNPGYFDLKMTVECGQCFRFDMTGEKSCRGVVGDSLCDVSQAGEDIIIRSTGSMTKEDYVGFFALDVDYGRIREDIAAHFPGETIRKAMAAGEGIRILRQPGWEAVCSFIISQNNNIPRIKKIIQTISERFGERHEGDGEVYYSFPTAEALLLAGEEEIFDCKTGFRAKYIIDAANKFVSGELSVEALRELDCNALITELMKVKGIGLKVASCAALYGFEKYSAFPIDVWMKRIIEKYYPAGLDISSLGEYAGIAQQYLFYYERSINN